MKKYLFLLTIAIAAFLLPGQNVRAESVSRITSAENLAEAIQEMDQVVDVDVAAAKEDPFETCRLLVARPMYYDQTGAEDALTYDGMTILQYETKEEAEDAYRQLSSRYGEDAVMPDAILELFEDALPAADAAPAATTTATTSIPTATTTATTSTPAATMTAGTSIPTANGTTAGTAIPAATTTAFPNDVTTCWLSGSTGTHLSWGVQRMGLDVLQQVYTVHSTPLSPVTVAVVDTGVDYNSPYLQGRVDTVHDTDLYNKDDDAMDDHGHGTHVVGILCDCTTENVTVLPVKVMSSEGTGSLTSFFNGLEYVKNLQPTQRIDVLNMSLGLSLDKVSAEIQAKFEGIFVDLKNAGTVVVCAAGNFNCDVATVFPACSSNVITVGAIDSSDGRYSGTCYGEEVDFAAPGVNISSAVLNNQTGTKTGTSMAAPHVAAAAAMIKARNPGYSRDQVYNILKSYADDIGTPGKDDAFGWGVVDMTCAAVDSAIHNSSMQATDISCTTTTATYTCSFCSLNLTRTVTPLPHLYDSGTVTLAPTCTTTGTRTYTCTVCSTGKQENIAALGHQLTYLPAQAPTALTQGLTQGAYCQRCDYQEAQKSVAKLPGRLTANASSLVLKVKQSTRAFSITALQTGDRIVSVVSQNPKVVTVNPDLSMKAGKKAGKTNLVITCASGYVKKIPVKVQKSAVACTKVRLDKYKLTLKKGGKYKLTTTISPITCVQKVYYTSSKKKVAKVDKKGQITALKKGTARITVKCGKKKAVCTVKVS